MTHDCQRKSYHHSISRNSWTYSFRQSFRLCVLRLCINGGYSLLGSIVSQSTPTQHEMTEDQIKLFDALTPLQQKVATHSLKGHNNVDSYKLGGGKAKTNDAAEASASQIFGNLKFKAFIDAMKQASVTSAVMGRTEMLERLSVLSRVNMSDLIEWRTTLSEDAEGQEVEQSCWAMKESAILDDHKLASIAEVKAGRDGFTIKQHSPLSAMKQLSDLAGYNEPIKTELTGKDGGAIETSDMSERELARRIAFALAKGARK